MRGTQEAGAKFRTEAREHLVRAHGNYRGAYQTSNFPGYVDTHTIDDALRDSLIGYGVTGALCVGAKGRRCLTCWRILQAGRPRFGPRWYSGKGYLALTGWEGFVGPCCNRDPENNNKPFERVEAGT